MAEFTEQFVAEFTEQFLTKFMEQFVVEFTEQFITELLEFVVTSCTFEVMILIFKENFGPCLNGVVPMTEVVSLRCHAKTATSGNKLKTESSKGIHMCVFSSDFVANKKVFDIIEAITTLAQKSLTDQPACRNQAN